jgi:ABC-type uncharacterized transport system fused permease/ATPase subunit
MHWGVNPAKRRKAMEAVICEAMKQRLSATAMVSIGLRPSLRKWHEGVQVQVDL